ncbi:hypothetical protein [Flavobacterium sp.]|uniref:hypothetical protein n=1 Tax=Flavobacterium sp. TaxID=239 RepID=UPI0039E50FC5
MNRQKRLLLIVSALLLSVFICRGWLYRQLIDYRTIGQRNPVAAGAGLQKMIDERAETQTNDIDQIVSLSLSITAEHLHFSTAKCGTDPNALVQSKAAHCVGYAAFFTSCCNQLIHKNGLQGKWIAEHQKGQLYVLGFNIHRLSPSAFWKDHDFVLVKNQQTREVIAIDPTVDDYLMVDRVRYR